MDIDTTLTSNRLREGNYTCIEVEGRVGFLPHPSLQLDDRTDYAEVQFQTSDGQSKLNQVRNLYHTQLTHTTINCYNIYT